MDKVKTYLLELEKQYSFEIIYSCALGSYAWGYNNKESDIDIKIIFKNKIDDYLSLEKERTTLALEEYKYGIKYDVKGFDIRRFCELVIKNNLTTCQWLRSPIVFINKLSSAEIKLLNNQIKTHNNFYFTNINGLIKPNFCFLKNKTRVKTKLYLHILRSILTNKYFEQNSDFNQYPLIINELLDSVQIDIEIKKIIKKYVNDQKSGILIVDTNKKINDWIENEISIQTKFSKTLIKYNLNESNKEINEFILEKLIMKTT